MQPCGDVHSITVNVIGETIKESNETYTVRLSAPTNAVIGDSDGLGTIIDDDQTPMLAVQSTSLSEGNNGKKTMTFARANDPCTAMRKALVGGKFTKLS